MAVLFTILLLFSFSLYTVSAFPFGAPTAACLYMYPKHEGTEKQQSHSPFSIALSSTAYNRANITLTISSSGARTFKGIFIRARRITGDTEEVLGTFSTVVGETLVYPVNCFGEVANMVTHTSNDEKTDLTVIWQPPASSVGDVVFTATFVANFVEFWTDVRSLILTNPSPTPNKGSLEETANTDPQLNLDETCGKSKGCFLNPSHCTGSNCDAAVSYQTVGNTLQFEIFGKAEGWVSVGFSDDKMMGMDETVTCTAQGSRVTVQRGFNPQKYNERQYATGLTDMRTIQRDGKIYCGFTRPMVTRVLSVVFSDTGVPTPINRTYDLRQDFYMLLGWGYTFQDTDVMNKHDDKPVITYRKVNFKTYEIHTDKQPLPAHGSITTGKIQNIILSVLVPLLWCTINA